MSPPSSATKFSLHGPSRFPLQVVGPLGDDLASLVRAWPDQVLREATQPPGILQRVPTPGLASGWVLGSTIPGDVTCLDLVVLVKVSLTALCLTHHLEPVCHGRPYQGHLSPRQHSL
ncbi:hypothetical protein CHARACLAT_026484 [Characodon lateralis]|uniref:Uncharacterized protein n=1 Tax=Characodon lateralis TaxID=208331 RepID=A0ABU7DNS1_9TELE|nr:hypothetical protein [Characodon lateralis]